MNQKFEVKKSIFLFEIISKEDRKTSMGNSFGSYFQL
jgi:hypothetical protein